MPQQFTNFCCRSGGSNLNAGTRTGSDTVPGTSADFTYASGNWVASTGVFTVASGNPSGDGVAVGDFASVYANGATETGFVGRVTARDATTITVSLTVKAGTAPTNGTGDRTLKVGGAWRGPNSTTLFPLKFIATALKDTTGRFPRVNFKNDVVYEIYSPGATYVNSAPAQITWQGFSSAYGDFGRAEMRGDPTAPVAYPLIFFMEGGGGIAVSNACKDLLLGDNGDEGDINGSGHTHQGLLSYIALVLRCSASHNWISSYDFNGHCIEGECYDYDFGEAANMAAWVGSNNLRCFAHDSNPEPRPYTLGSTNIAGFHVVGMNIYCIAANCYGNGMESGYSFINCDSYNNRLNGVQGVEGTMVINSNATSNGTAGFGYSNTTNTLVQVETCRYGQGTEANGDSIDPGIPQADVSGLPTNQSPWVDADSGNFTLFLDDCFETGKGDFMQIMPGYGGSVSYPDIGAARHETHVRNMVLPLGFGGGM
jgi:hypothetical protein